MSALLSLNSIPLISWKGQTFTQIHSSIQKNGEVNSHILQVRGLFSARPLKIYRREIASTNSPVCHSKNSIKIDIFNRPNGTINNTDASTINDLANIIDITLPNNTCELYTNCSVVLSPAENARNRVRSSGMIKRKFNDGRNNDTYYTSSSQYLTSRNRTFAQNQYNYIRQGDSTAKPGSSLASANVYTPAGLNHCAKYYIAQNTSFSYKWINKYDQSEPREIVVNNTEYPVNIPAGYYSLDDVNRIFKQTMFANLHYFIKDSTRNSSEYYSDNISFPLNIAFNNNTQVIELQSYIIDTNSFPVTSFTVPSMLSGLPSWSVPVSGSGLYPQFVIEDNIFKNAIGFNEGSYPENISNEGDADAYTASSSFSPGLKPMYVKLYYKPNNPQFAQQGGVNSSDLITRKKYNSITNSTAAYRTAFGGAVANALAYGVPSYGYTVKDKLGYPLKKTPTFSKYTDEMKQCSVTTIANAI
jgi:hypothetical protein